MWYILIPKFQKGDNAFLALAALALARIRSHFFELHYNVKHKLCELFSVLHALARARWRRALARARGLENGPRELQLATRAHVNEHSLMLARARSRELDPTSNTSRVIGSVQTSNFAGGQTFTVSKFEGFSNFQSFKV